MRLSEHFTLEELTKSQTAVRRGIDNTPSAESLENLELVCEHILEPIRNHFGIPFSPNSGYRSPELNAAVGGSTSSQHMSGGAVDVEVPGIPNKDLFRWVRDNLEFDQIILEFYREGVEDSGWVHISYRHGDNRKQVLFIG